MIINYIKVTLRNIRRHKGYYLINILGLTIGIVCFILISLFVLDELSYDRYHEKADQIYRVGVRALVNDNEFHGATACAPMAQTLVKEFPEVQASTRLRGFGDPVIRYKEKVFSEERWFFADATVFDVFTIPIIQGDSKTALSQPNTVLITESMADKYFGQEDPMGKTLNADGRRDYLITGVIEDVPRNSHVHYDFLASFETFESSHSQNWISNNHHTYFVLNKGASSEEFETKLQTLVEKYVQPQVKGALGVTPEEFYASGGEFEYFLQPLTDIHLRSHLDFEHEPNSDITYVYLFSVIAVAILLIACINFVNQATARSDNRAKEVGVRKTVGSTRNQITRQFIAEAVILSVMAVLLALPLIEILLPSFNNLTGKSLSVPYLESAMTIPYLLGIALVVGALAGTYPAFFLASFDPVVVIKGGPAGKKRTPWMRNVLVVFQFMVSIILIIGTLVVYRQLEFIQNRKLGFNREQVIVIHKVDDLGPKIWAFKRDLLSQPGLSSVANSSYLMGDSFGDNLYTPSDRPQDQKELIWRLWTDPDFVDAFQLQIVQGSYFPSELKEGSRPIILNEAAVSTLQLSDPIGKKLIDMEGRDFTITGVVKDFHFESLHKTIKPLSIHPLGPNHGSGRYMSVRISTDNFQESLSKIKSSWDKFAGGQAFEYEFFDDYFAKVFLAEEKTGQVFLVFTLLAIAIACLGLFGLTSFITEQRTKEIGIRKVLGASIPKIIYLLTRQLAWWVLVANVIAWPLAYIVMHRWLENFAYRANISVWIFVLSAGMALLIALLTVSYQSIRAALANPADSLRYE